MIWECFEPQTESTYTLDFKYTEGQISLQCDYDRDCTSLYKMIENKEWTAVNQFLDSGRLDSQNQVKTVVSQHVNGKVGWSRLPLHQAIRLHAPYSVIRRLVELFPKSIRWADHNGSLAVHYALFFEASDDVVAYLLMRYPESVNVRNNAGYTPLQATLKIKNNIRSMILATFVDNLKLADSTTTDTSSRKAMTPTKAFQCEYNNCTKLYKKIQKGEWQSIVIFLDTGSWKNSFFEKPDKISPTQQVQTWVSRHDPVEGKLIWTLLPIHAAIARGAPFSVTRRLIDYFPDSVRYTDDRGMLPIHLALFHSSNDSIVAKLLMEFPGSVNETSLSGRTPLDCALRAKDKVRGTIINTFVRKTVAKREEDKILEVRQEDEDEKVLEDIDEEVSEDEDEKVLEDRQEVDD